MVNTRSENNSNVVTATNNMALYYSELAKESAEEAKRAEDNIAELLEGESLATVNDNIESINSVASNIDDINSIASNLDDIINPNVAWGDIEGSLTSQTDLKEALDLKAAIADLSEVASTGDYNDLENKPDLSTYATKPELNSKADSSDIPTKVSDLQNDSGFLTSFTETDPTVPAWAKNTTKPTYTKSEIGLANVDNTSDLDKPISTAVQTELDKKIESSDLAEVATSGSYNDLSDKPEIPNEYTLPTASTQTLGGVKIDGTSITISDGVISSQIGVTSYNDLTNKPKINNVVIAGNQSLDKLGIQPAGDYALKSEIPTVPDNITTQGNSFNAANQLVKLDASGKLPALDGSQLTGIDTSSVVLDDSVSENSSNGVKSSGIYDAIQTVLQLLFPTKEEVTMSGTVSLEFGKMKYGELTSDVTFSLPQNFNFNGQSIADNAPKRIITQIEVGTSHTINFGTTRYVNETAPDMSKSGYYTVIHEYDENAAEWSVNSFYKGAIEGWGGGGDDGGGQWGGGGDIWG